MTDEIEETLAPEFQAAVFSIRQAANRAELVVEELAAPSDIATHAIAFSAEVSSETSEVPGSLGTGRFVLFWSPQPQENWTTNFRIVCFSRAPLESDITSEDQSAEITWTWLTDALAIAGAEHSAIAGTTTRIISKGHGMMANEKNHAELEMRASWSPHGTDIAKHFEAWQNLVCIMSGFELTPGVGEVHR